MKVSLSETFGEDAEEVKAILIMLSSEGKNDAQIKSVGTKKNIGGNVCQQN